MYLRTLTMSKAGMPSVMATTSEKPASVASMIASAAKAGGTKARLTSAPVAVIASRQLLNTGSPCSDLVPPLPGETPPTRAVPYSMHWAAWNAPALPVRP